MTRMVRCSFCGETYDLYQVEVTARYSDCSMWKTPCCNTTADDRGETGWKTRRDVDWRDRAACRGVDPELFFPVGNSGLAELQVEQALAVCRRCPVRQECIRTAVEAGETDGVWGIAPKELRKIGVRREPNPVDRRTIRQTHCRNNHLITDESSYIDSRGARSCKRCRAHSELQRRRALRAKAGVL